MEFIGLPVGTKYVVMETASVGYMPNVILNGTLDNDGKIHESGAQLQPGDGHVGGTLDKTGTTVVTYVNEVMPGYVLPDTGGSGVGIFMISGSVMVLAGIAVIACRRKRGV